jgi:hypothetical protein
MVHHKFKVGQIVDFTPSRPSVPASGRRCQIVRLLPAESGELQYRIKCKSENFERVVKESELSRHTST